MEMLTKIISADLLHYPEHVPVFLMQRDTLEEEEVSSYTYVHAKELARVLLK